MSMLSGFKKVRRRIRLPDGYKLLSFWTSSQSVEMDDGTTLESNKTKWDDASSKKHEHSNKTALDQITSDKLSQWDSLAASSVTGVKGNAETTYRKGNVNVTPANIGALPTTGGTITGNITANMYSSSQIPLKVYGGDTYGQGLSIGAGACTIVGGGESAKALESLVSATNEELHLASDNNIYFEVNCNTIANKLQVVLDRSRNFYPSTNGTGSIGTSTNKWGTVYTTKLNNTTINSAGTASPTAYGVTKLYTSTGNNTDGAMTQKAVTDYINSSLSAKIQTFNVIGANSPGVKITIIDKDMAKAGTTYIGSIMLQRYDNTGNDFTYHTFCFTVMPNAEKNTYLYCPGFRDNGTLSAIYIPLTMTMASGDWEQITLYVPGTSGYRCSGAQYTKITP